MVHIVKVLCKPDFTQFPKCVQWAAELANPLGKAVTLPTPDILS